ncbi:hypothetical protein Tco_1386076 [Tanacetum coccineum]
MKKQNSFLALEDDSNFGLKLINYQDTEGTKTVEPFLLLNLPRLYKELPPHLEYAFLEGDNKLPVIIAKDLKDEEKAALLKVLKSTA